MVEFADIARVIAQCKSAAADLRLLDPGNELLDYFSDENSTRPKKDPVQLKEAFWDGTKPWDHSSYNQTEVSYRVLVRYLGALAHEIEGKSGK